MCHKHAGHLAFVHELQETIESGAIPIESGSNILSNHISSRSLLS